MTTKQIAIEYLAIDKLKPFAGNPRKITDADMGKLRKSLREFGFVDPIIARRDDLMVIGGHQRLQAAKLEKWTKKIPVVLLDGIDDAHAKILNVALNKISGDFDEDKLSELFASLDILDVDLNLELTGFDADEIDIMISDIGNIASDSSATTEAANQTLAERFVVPPFSTLDTRQGYWQERKSGWIGIGIRSELGGRDKLKSPSSGAGAIPGYYNYKQNAEEKLGRALNCSEFEEKYLADYLPKDSHLATTETGGILSIFDPVLCEIAYRWFCPAHGRILDPFAGGSVRGIVAAWLGHEYTGIDLQAEQIQANQDQAHEIGVEKAPRWLVGDSRDVLQDMEPGFDFVFSCPPYADLEIYSDDPNDLSNMDYSDFMAAYREIITKSVKLLRENRFACFVVGDIRDKKGFYRNFVGDTVTAFQDAGMTLYNEAILITAIGSLPTRVGGAFVSSRKLGKAHQNVLVFYKGDPKAIKGEFSDVEIGDHV